MWLSADQWHVSRNGDCDFHATALKEKSACSSVSLSILLHGNLTWQRAVLEHAFKDNSSGMMEEREITILSLYLSGTISSTNCLFLGNLMKVKLMSTFLASSNVICILLIHGRNPRKRARWCMRCMRKKQENREVRVYNWKSKYWLTSTEAHTSTQLAFVDRKVSPSGHVHHANTTSSFLLPDLCTCFLFCPEFPLTPTISNTRINSAPLSDAPTENFRRAGPTPDC